MKNEFILAVLIEARDSLKLRASRAQTMARVISGIKRCVDESIRFELSCMQDRIGEAMESSRSKSPMIAQMQNEIDSIQDELKAAERVAALVANGSERRRDEIEAAHGEALAIDLTLSVAAEVKTYGAAWVAFFMADTQVRTYRVAARAWLDMHDEALELDAILDGTATFTEGETLAAHRKMYYHGHSEVVHTHELKEGDLIRHYHMLIRLGKRTDWGVTDGHTEDYHGACISFAGDVVFVHGCPNDANPMPQGYQVQGNRLAHWALIVA